jgi:hypothetical protein
MTDPTGGGPPPSDDKAATRQAMEDAILAFRDPAASEGRGAPPDPDAALEGLAGASLPRVLKLRLLLDGLLRPDGSPSDDAVRRVLEATLPGGPDEAVEPSRVEEARRHLTDVAEAARDRQLRPEHWDSFTARTGDLFGFDVHELTFEGGCNDEVAAVKATPDGTHVKCRLIEAQFWSDRPPSAFARWVNPRHWPRCSEAWEAMRPLKGEPPERGDYDNTFEEVVVIGGTRLRVPLEVGFRERRDGSRVWVRFNIDREVYERWVAAGDALPVTVDTGTVSAEAVPGGPARTLVRMTKYLHLADGDRMFPELACDAGWVGLMIAMADACDEPVASTRAAGASPGATAAGAASARAAAVDPAVRQFVEEVANKCRRGIDQTSPHVQKLISRFTGPSWDPRWVNDLLEIGLVTARRYGAVASSVRGLADELRAADQRRRS